MRAPKVGGETTRVLTRKILLPYDRHYSKLFVRNEHMLAMDADTIYFVDGTEIRALPKPR